MAKGLPYFKFIVTDWLTGDIVFEDLETQGLFINICAIYWQRDGDLSVQDIEKRFKCSDRLAKLSDRFISVDDDQISIRFLDEQLHERGHVSEKNSKNGKLGALARANKTEQFEATAKRSLSETERPLSKEEKRREEKNRVELEERKEEKKFSVSDIKWPFTSLKFYGAWNLWLSYRKEQHGFSYKKIGMQATLTDLQSMSNDNEENAIELIEHAIKKTWKGFYPINNQQNGTTKPSFESKREQIINLKDKYAAKISEHLNSSNDTPSHTE